MRYRAIQASLIAALLLAALPGCTTVFFQPDRQQYFTPKQAGLTAEDVAIRDGNGPTLHGWWLPAQLTEKYRQSATEPQPKGTVLFLHGNAQNISAHIAAVHWLPKAGYNVFMPDYRGYGRSAGKAEINGALEDVERALHWLHQRGELAAENKVVVFGQSLGGALALLATAQSPYRERIDGLISDSAFSSFRGIAREKVAKLWPIAWLRWPISWLMTGKHQPLKAIASLSPMRVLLLHGTADVAVPSHHSQALYTAAKQPKTLWLGEQARHIEMAHQPPWRTRLLEWLAAVEAD